MYSGSCLCRAVTLSVDGPLTDAGACHCTQCRKQSGHFWASAAVARSSVTVTGKEHVAWYSASQGVARGFCSICGSFLFWDKEESGLLEISLGAFDGPTDTNLLRHIFVANKGDYYEIGDNVPKHEQE